MSDTDRLAEPEANEVEAEMRRLLADPDVSKNAVRLFMQHPMRCGHAAGNLLTCDDPPFGCVVCNDSTKIERLRAALENAERELTAFRQTRDAWNTAQAAFGEADD